MAIPVHPSALVQPAATRRASILFVEDCPDQKTLMSHMLRWTLPELRPVWAADANSALAYLADCEAQHEPLPRLTLLDLYLPTREQGWALLRHLKQKPALCRMPVVVLSRSIDKEDISMSYTLGATSYITKPGTLDEWMAYFQSVRHCWFSTITLPKA